MSNYGIAEYTAKNLVNTFDNIMSECPKLTDFSVRLEDPYTWLDLVFDIDPNKKYSKNVIISVVLINDKTKQIIFKKRYTINEIKENVSKFSVNISNQNLYGNLTVYIKNDSGYSRTDFVPITKPIDNDFEFVLSGSVNLNTKSFTTDSGTNALCSNLSKYLGDDVPSGNSIRLLKPCWGRVELGPELKIYMSNKAKEGYEALTPGIFSNLSYTNRASNLSVYLTIFYKMLNTPETVMLDRLKAAFSAYVNVSCNWQYNLRGSGVEYQQCNFYLYYSSTFTDNSNNTVTSGSNYAANVTSQWFIPDGPDYIPTSIETEATNHKKSFTVEKGYSNKGVCIVTAIPTNTYGIKCIQDYGFIDAITRSYSLDSTSFNVNVSINKDLRFDLNSNSNPTLFSKQISNINIGNISSYFKYKSPRVDYNKELEGIYIQSKLIKQYNCKNDQYFPNGSGYIHCPIDKYFKRIEIERISDFGLDKNSADNGSFSTTVRFGFWE